MTISSRQMQADMTFVDRVMVAIGQEEAPTPVRSFLSGVRSSSPVAAARALSAAWHLGTQREWSIGPRARARSMALVLAVLFAMASAGTLAAATAVQVAHVLGEIGEQGTVQNGQSGHDEQGQHEGTPVGGVLEPSPDSAGSNQGPDENQNANDRDEGQASTGQGRNEAVGQAADDGDHPQPPIGPGGRDDGAPGQSNGESPSVDHGVDGQDGG